VAKLLAQGCSNLEIALHRKKQVSTTKAQVASVLRKLGVTQRVRAALILSPRAGQL